MAARPRLLLLLLAVLLPAAGARAGEEARPGEQAAALYARYEKLLHYNDFNSFSDRMTAVRDLGALPGPVARGYLFEIVRGAKLLDDKAVAVISLGAGLDVPTAVKVADLVAARAKPVLVQALADCFSRTNDEAVRTWLATEALHHKSDAVLQAVLDAEYAHADPRILERTRELFEAYAGKREGIAIAHAAVRALGSIGGRPVRAFLLRAVGHDDWRVRLGAADVMAWQKPFDVNVRGALRKLLVDDEPVVRQRAAQTIGEAHIEELLPEVAARLEDAHIKTRAVAHDALARLTDKDLGYDPRDWLNWWKNRPVEEGHLKPSPSSSVATYYGVNVRSDRLIFIVDVSGSMAMPRGADTTRIDVARQELTRVLTHLDPDTLFNVIVFSDKVKAWRKGEALATPANVEKVQKWIAHTLEEPRGGTFMHAALETAFAENPEMDTVYLLTDGLATDGEPIVPEAILASVNEWNRYRRVVIHTFALTLEEESPTGIARSDLDAIKAFMKQLARVTGGTCTAITKAPR